MCGIAGICRNDDQPIDRGLLAEMSARLRHRGPDDEGFHVAGSAGLAFRRLAILDLSPAGHQPMTASTCPACPHGDVASWLVFNGEIYNYRDLAAELQALGHTFRSRSDSETVLHAYQQWGPDCVRRLNGMFAFAIWDGRRQRLFAARDRFGIKPFYYHLDSDRLCFASEIKALFADPATPARPNERRLYDYLVYGYLDHTAETCFSGIRQLPPAHILTFERGNVKIERYWDLDPAAGLGHLGDADAAGRYRELFFDSVRRHLQSDVPIGTCLSGGLDSSAIVCTVSRLLEADRVDRSMIGERQRTFTSCFDDPRFDERRYAAVVAQQTGAQSYLTFPDPNELFDILPRLIWHQEEPFGSTSIVAQWYVMQAARRAGVTVLLDGQGSDEILGGYHPFFSGLWAGLMQGGRFLTLLRELRGYHARHGSLSRILLTGAVGLALPQGVRAQIQQRRGRTRPGWLGPSLVEQDYPWIDPPAPARDPLRRQMYQYLTTTLLPSLLHYEDRNSMAFSIEARVPFLDHRLVELTFALPGRFKLRNGETKWLLRRALADVLPRAVVERQDKMAFVTPEAIWFRETLRAPAEAVFRSASFRQRPYWQPDEVLRLFDAHAAGRVDHHILLWRFLNTEFWLRQFVDRRPAEPAGIA